MTPGGHGGTAAAARTAGAAAETERESQSREVLQEHPE